MHVILGRQNKNDLFPLKKWQEAVLFSAAYVNCRQKSCHQYHSPSLVGEAATATATELILSQVNPFTASS